MTDVTVETGDLRAALSSVLVHADLSREPMPAFANLRLVVGAVNMKVAATTGFSAGHAIVSVLDNRDGECGAPFDLSPRDVREILAVFPNPSKEELSGELRLEVDREHVRVTDVGGLFDGKQLTLPRQPVSEDFPDIEAVIRGRMVGDRAGRFRGERLVASGERLASFKAAVRAYGQPLVIEIAGHDHPVLLVMCGESFIGLLTTLPVDEEQGDRLRDWRAGWLRRLPQAPRWSTGAQPDGPEREAVEALRDLQSATGAHLSITKPSTDK